MSMQIPQPAHPVLLLLAVALGAPALASPSAAQDPTAGLRGIVVDSAAGEPIAGVLVKLGSGAETLTSDRGRFELMDLTPGSHVVALLSADCQVTWTEVEIEPDSVLDTRFTLSRAPSAEERRTREDRRRSQGAIVTGDEIQEMRLRSLAEVIRRIEPGMVGSSAAVGAVAPIRSRSRNSFTDEGMEPVVVVDGVRAADGSRMIHSIDPADVALLEILPGSVAGWEYGSDGAAGVIRVTTLKGRVGNARPDAGGCVVPDFPVG